MFQHTSIINKRPTLLLSDPNRYQTKFRCDPKDDEEFAYKVACKIGRSIWVIRMIFADIFSYKLTCGWIDIVARFLRYGIEGTFIYK